MKTRLFLTAGVFAFCALLALAISQQRPAAPSVADIAATTPEAAAPAVTRAATPDARPDALLARRVTSAPHIDGHVEASWAQAEPLVLDLLPQGGGVGALHQARLRALYDQTALYFLIEWAGALPGVEPEATANLLTVHWRLPPQPEGMLPMHCDVACHTAFASGQGRIAWVNAETIPQGGRGVLPAAGGWKDGLWTFEWRRPLLSSNPYDLQFNDRQREYEFFVKLFHHGEDERDALSSRRQLVFQP